MSVGWTVGLAIIGLVHYLIYWHLCKNLFVKTETIRQFEREHLKIAATYLSCV